VIPLWLKLVYTAFVAVLVPFYWRNYGVANFLWFSDIALLTTLVALWTENRLLASMMAVGVVLPEIVWNVGFFGRLLTGYEFGGIAGYMFDARQPLFLRGLSMFHVFLPVLLIWMVWRLGYHPRAWLAITVVTWVVLPLSYLATEPSENINWVLGIGSVQTSLPPLVYLSLLIVLFPAVLYYPTHLILRRLFPLP
jgi:hypothetical protein